MSFSDKFRQLLEFIKDGDEGAVRELLNHLSPEDRLKLLMMQDNDSDTAVHYAAYNGHTDTAKCLLNNQPPADLYQLLMIQNKNGNTVVHNAANNGHTDTVKCLLDNLPPADLYKLLMIQKNDSDTAVHYAANNGHTDTAKCLLNNQPPADLYQLLMIQNNDGDTAVHYAAYNGHTDTVKCLLDNLPSADLYKLLMIQNNDGDTAVHYAAYNGHTDTVKCLLDNLPSADLYKLLMIQNNDGDTAVHYAAYNGHTDTVKCLLDNLPSADLYKLMMIQDNDGDTAVHCASVHEDESTVQFLLESLPLISRQEILQLKNKDNKTPLGIARTEGGEETVLCVAALQWKGAGAVKEEDSDFSDDDLTYLDETNKDVDVINLPMKRCVRQSVRDKFYTDFVYRMSGPTRGRCLIINNKNFDLPTKTDQVRLEPRHGSEMDVENLTRVFGQLDFDYHELTDRTRKKMIQDIRGETRHPDYPNLGASVLVIMTHGTENGVYGIDGRLIKYSDIFDLLSAYNFEGMAGKPKMVILQVCSGDRSDTMGHLTDDSIPSVLQARNFQTTDLPFPGDFLATDDLFIMWASFRSFISKRHERQGTWFIRALVETLYKHACHKDIQSIFQQVKDKVRAKSILATKRDINVGGQQPTENCFPTKRRKFFLFPKFNPQ